MAEQKKQPQEQQGGARGSREPAAGGRQGGEVTRRDLWMPAAGRGPFAFMRRFAEEMDRLMDDLGLGTLSPDIEIGQRAGTWTPPIEAFARAGQFVVRADLPGLSRDDVQVEVRNDGLLIHGQRSQEREERKEGWYRSERSYGSFSRSVPLPEGADPEKAEASFENGVLEIRMPLQEGATRGRRIEIKGGASAKSAAGARAGS
jgi:HSP20 family protein